MNDSRKANDSIVRWGCAAVFVTILLLVTAAAAFLLGAVIESRRHYSARAEEHAVPIRAFLSKHQAIYAELEVNEASSGYSYLTGFVRTPADLELLKNEMKRLFGEELDSRMTEGVYVLAPTGEMPAKTDAD